MSNTETDSTVTEEDVRKAVRTIMLYMGDNPDREGLLETPDRYVRFINEFFKPQEPKCTVFQNEGIDQMILVDRIPFYSLCEHHIVPFFGYAAVAYIPEKNGKIVGLSKLGRIVDFFARRLQNQERITTQIADYLQEKVNPNGIAVLLKCRHLCMEMRGLKKSALWTTTSCLRGRFREDEKTRNEFMSLAGSMSEKS